MKILSTAVCLFLFLHTAMSEGIQFFHGTLNEAKEVAAQQGKLLFIDAFTTWCGPCKRMSSQVFSQDDVGEFYNQTFINLKLDMEKGEGKDFQRQYRVTAFPTLLFLDPEGKVVHRLVGGLDVPNFIKLGKFAASKSSITSTLDKEYEDGRRDPQFMADYIEALAKSNRPVLKIANDYLSTQNDYQLPENLKIIYHGLVEVDSRIFNLLIENRKPIEKIFGKEAVEAQIAKAADATVKKAIEFNSADLLEEANDKVKRYAGNEYKQFEYTSRLKYYSSTRQPEMFLKYAKEYVKQSTRNKFELTNEILHTQQDQPLLIKQATDWSLELVKEEANEHNCFTAAQLLYIDGQYSQSKHYAEEALKFAEEAKSGALPHIKKLISSIEMKIGVDKS
ncbi:MAG: thioredoxin family protein [Saprospiraceae bacterium]|nr:thioredoxin family protein [Saprospiraceae bacterium]